MAASFLRGLCGFGVTLSCGGDCALPAGTSQQLALCLSSLPCVFWTRNWCIPAWPLPRKTLGTLGWVLWNSRRPPARLCSSPSGLLPAAGHGAALAKEAAQEGGEEAELLAWQRGPELELSVLSLPQGHLKQRKREGASQMPCKGWERPQWGFCRLLAGAGGTNPALGTALQSEGCKGTVRSQGCLSRGFEPRQRLVQGFKLEPGLRYFKGTAFPLGTATSSMC